MIAFKHWRSAGDITLNAQRPNMLFHEESKCLYGLRMIWWIYSGIFCKMDLLHCFPFVQEFTNVPLSDRSSLETSCFKMWFVLCKWSVVCCELSGLFHPQESGYHCSSENVSFLNMVLKHQSKEDKSHFASVHITIQQHIMILFINVYFIQRCIWSCCKTS